MNKYLLEILEDNECVVATGFDEAIIGFSYGCCRAVYDIDQVLDILQREDGMTREDAMEHFDYNIAGSYVGPKTPIFVYCTDPAYTIEGSDE